MSCDGWSAIALYLYDWLPSQFISFLSRDKSRLHQRCEWGEGRGIGTTISIVSCSAHVRLSTAIWNCQSVSRTQGSGMPQRRSARTSLNLSQSVALKFLRASSPHAATSKSNVVSTGTWSVPGPLRLGSVSHDTMQSRIPAVPKTLSTQVQFFVAMDFSVGNPFGRIIFKPWSSRRDISI